MRSPANPRWGFAFAFTVIAGNSFPAFAQPDEVPTTHSVVEEQATPEDNTLVIDILAVREDVDRDQVLEERCEEIADAARVANEIIVCRDLGETTDGSWDQEDFIRRYAEATQGVKTPNVDGSGLYLNLPPIVAIKGCFIPPCPGEPALLIDVSALPKAPAGSDADRIARGLPPLGASGDGGRTTDEAELGLPPVPDFDAGEE